MRALPTFVCAFALAATACCKKAPPPANPATPDPVAVAPAPAPDPEAERAKAEADRLAKEQAEKDAAEAEAKRKQAEQLAAMYTELEADTAKEAARWTEDLTKQSTALVAKKYANPKAAFTAILKSSHRVPGHSDRDSQRHPLETLTFIGLKQNMTVIEVGAGEGWYTELLAPFLAKSGKLIVGAPDPNGPADSGRTFYGKRTQAFLAKSPAVFGKVEMVVINPPDQLSYGPDASVDAVLAFREVHGWQRRNFTQQYLKAIHNVLKPNGILAIEAHRAAPGGDPNETVKKGYLPEQWVIDTVTAAGFKLAGKSEVNANPKDTKDYEQGVWTLPPAYALGETDKEKYKAIGESDRMTLKFVKVAAPAPAAKQ